jgi:hypothetical protein
MNIELTMLNLTTNKTFTLNFSDLYRLRDFVRKCKYSKKVKIIGQFGYETESQMRFVNNY